MALNIFFVVFQCSCEWLIKCQLAKLLPLVFGTATKPLTKGKTKC